MDGGWEGKIPRIGVGELIERYPGVLLDAYGVLVSSRGALPGAAALLERLDAGGRPWLVVTNDASRDRRAAATFYRSVGLGVPEDHILMSGDLLPDWFATRGLVGAPTVVLGPARSLEVVAAAGARIVPWTSRDAEALVVADQSGFDLLEGINAAMDLAFRRAEAGRPLWMVLPNPDLIYPRGGGRYGITSGSVALVIEAGLAQRFPGWDGAGRLVFDRLGKPHAPIFAAALARLGLGRGERPVMVGDTLETDIRGARDFGLDAVLVGSGNTLAGRGALPQALWPTGWLPSLEAGEAP